ncbi:MAG: 50S ribosomal protein L4 [Bdellovibrionales bacterium]|nr:50S ribosomal protein L4 [Bdellovibrionales bacterium]
MAQVEVLNWKKEKVGTVKLSEEVFGKPVRKDILQQVVRWQLACRRQGTHATKTKGFVSGGGKKPFKQKGTGGARQGSSRSPLMPGGGTMFGPQPRDYSYNIPRSLKITGLKTALSYLVANNKFFVVEDMDSKGKTKELAKRLADFGVGKAVLVDAKSSDTFARASRNLEKFRYYSSEGVNVYDLLKYDTAIITKEALKQIEERLGEKA